MLLVAKQDAIAAGEARREPQVPERHRQEPGEIPARPFLPFEKPLEIDRARRSLGREGVRFLNHSVDGIQALDRRRARALDVREPGGEARPRRPGQQIGRELLLQLSRILEGVFSRVRLGQEIERVRGLEIGDQFQRDPEPRDRFGEVEPSQVVLEGIADPVQKVGLGLDRQREGRDPRALFGRRAQAQPVRGQAAARARSVARCGG